MSLDRYFFTCDSTTDAKESRREARVRWTRSVFFFCLPLPLLFSANTRRAIRFTCEQMQRRDVRRSDTAIGMILLRVLVTARRECDPSLPLSSRQLSTFFFCYLYAKPSRVVAILRRRRRRRRRQYSGSRKSQINPFVIPHRSFQPVRISTTRFYATSAPTQGSLSHSPPSPLAPFYSSTEGEIYSSSLSIPFSSARITLFSPFLPLAPSFSLARFLLLRSIPNHSHARARVYVFSYVCV